MVFLYVQSKKWSSETTKKKRTFPQGKNGGGIEKPYE